MKSIALVAALFVCSQPALAQMEIYQKFAKATALYKCHYFFKASASEAADESQRARLNRISDSLSVQASTIALQTGGESLNTKISRQGEVEFKKFMEESMRLPTTPARNERFSAFIQSCAATAGVKLDGSTNGELRP
jgi:hypothetical protein